MFRKHCVSHWRRNFMAAGNFLRFFVKVLFMGHTKWYSQIRNLKKQWLCNEQCMQAVGGNEHE
jgi:hypothetical protein